jgi:hypothetical protein
MQQFLTFADFEPFAWVLGFGIFGIVLAILAVALWVWSLVHAIRNPALDDMMRIVWVLVIVFTGLIGSLIYAIVAPKASGVTHTTYHHG